MIKNNIFDGFSVVLEKENEEWKAYFIEFPTVYGVSLSSIEAITRAKIKWEKYKEDSKKNGKELPLPVLDQKYTGRVNIRFDEDLHKALTNEAIQNNLSLNALIYKKLRQSTVNEKRDYHWNLDKVEFHPMDNSVFTWFSYNEKDRRNGAILSFCRSSLGDILGDSQVSSKSDLEKYIKHTPSLNESFQEFLQDQHYSGFVEKQKIIECVLTSTEEMRRGMHYLAKDLEEKFPKRGSFYIARVNG